MATNITSRKYAKFRQAMANFEKNFYQTVTKEMIDFGHRKSKKLADKFVELSKEYLNDATPAKESEHFVNSIKKGIRAEKVYKTYSKNGVQITKKLKGYKVIIPNRKDGLTMFLEYGTGLTGLRNPHEETTKYLDIKPWATEFITGWKYAVNRDKYKTVYLKTENSKNQRVKVTQPCYITKSGKRGFVFKKTKNSYIDKNDVEFHNEYTTKYSWVKGYPRNGKEVKAYIRYHKDKRTYATKTTYVLSTGLKPVRFIYRAKKEIQKMMKQNKI